MTTTASRPELTQTMRAGAPEGGAEDGVRFNLLVMGPSRFEARALMPGSPVSIGRGAPAVVRLDDPQVSRLHASVTVFADESVEVEDLGSVNGTWARQMRLTAGARFPIAPGEAVQVGPFVIMVTKQYTEPAEGPAPRAEAGRGAAAEKPGARIGALYALAERAALAPISVLILGETGAGKDVLARHIHARSSNRRGPFVALNCAALSETLLESELFGHEKGAFTGAMAAKPGLIESAGGGTLFLDEIGDMPLGVQAKLLRVLEAREVTRVGGLRPRRIDVRFLAATNRALDREVAERRFRADLFFRLNGLTLVVPPLRVRRDEIEGLAEHFAEAAAQAMGHGVVPRLSPDARAWLTAQSWPGNVRELRNVMERALLLAPADVIEVAHLAPAQPVYDDAQAPQAPAPPPVASLSGHEDERRQILDALEACAGNQSRAAALLGMRRKTFIARLERYRVARPRKGR